MRNKVCANNVHEFEGPHGMQKDNAGLRRKIQEQKLGDQKQKSGNRIEEGASARACVKAGAGSTCRHAPRDSPERKQQPLSLQEASASTCSQYKKLALSLPAGSHRNVDCSQED